MRPRLLDLFCGAGGAAMGYHRAGFDVTGVDIRPQPRYPFTFIQADALEFLDEIVLRPESRFRHGFDVIHASPPCQAYSRATTMQGHREAHPDLLSPVRDRLQASGLPWVIENVAGAPLRADIRLCGCMFGLAVQRDRWFETSWHAFDLRPPCYHPQRAVGVYGYSGPRPGTGRISGRHATWSKAMGIDWMEVLELAQAIPPVYTEHVGRQLLEHLARVRELAP